MPMVIVSIVESASVDMEPMRAGPEIGNHPSEMNIFGFRDVRFGSELGFEAEICQLLSGIGFRLHHPL